MSIKPVLVPDHDAASLRRLMDSFATASTGPTRQQLTESRAAVAAAQGVAEDMSRAAKGYEKYGREGMAALAKAGREGRDLDPVRQRYDQYNEDAAGDVEFPSALWVRSNMNISNDQAHLLLHNFAKKIAAQHGLQDKIEKIYSLAQQAAISSEDHTAAGAKFKQLLKKYLAQGVSEGSAGKELKAIDGDYYEDSTDFFSRFEQDHFDREEESSDGMEIRGYIDDECVMVFKYSTPDMMGGWGIYDDSALIAESGAEEAAGAMPVNKYIANELDTLLKLAQDHVDDIVNRSRGGYGNKKSGGLEDAIFELSGVSNGFHSSMEEGVAELQELNSELPRIGNWIMKNLKKVGNRIDLPQLIKQETSDNQGVTETHDEEEGETCPECDGAGCPECYGDEDRDRAHDHAQGMREGSLNEHGDPWEDPNYDPRGGGETRSPEQIAKDNAEHAILSKKLGLKNTNKLPDIKDDMLKMMNHFMGQHSKKKDVDESAADVKYGVFAKGGSVGSQRFRDDPLKTFDTKEEAVADARRRRSSLSPGERGYYRMGYVVKPIKGAAQQVDEISPATLGSYVKKSSADATQRQSKVTGHNEFQKGARTMAGAVYGDKVDRYPDRTDPKIARRQAGLNKAVDRLTPHEIDEKSEAVRHGNNSRSIYHVDESVDPIDQLRADIKRFSR